MHFALFQRILKYIGLFPHFCIITALFRPFLNYFVGGGFHAIFFLFSGVRTFQHLVAWHLVAWHMVAYFFLQVLALGCIALCCMAHGCLLFLAGFSTWLHGTWLHGTWLHGTWLPTFTQTMRKTFVFLLQELHN